MCLICYQPAGSPAFSPEILANGWSSNHDGAGYMFARCGELVIRKPFYKLAELKTAYAKDHAEFGELSAFVIHFRFATHGDKSVENVHPHSLASGKAGLVHNGILSIIDIPSKSFHSDTVWFCRTILAHRGPAKLLDGGFCEWLGELIGAGNKFVIMSHDGGVAIVNSESGIWDGNFWFSNSGYLADWSWSKPSGKAKADKQWAEWAEEDAMEQEIDFYEDEFAEAKSRDDAEGQSVALAILNALYAQRKESWKTEAKGIKVKAKAN